MTARTTWAIACAVLFGAAGCSPGYEGETSVVQLPSDVEFASVVAPLGFSCGSLDCHGQPGRNLRIYSRQGLRLDATDVPCGDETTDAEVVADYRSVAGLEPEVLAAVFHDGGAHPEQLTLIRKARGTEKHTGGVVFPEGSDGDKCLVDWIRGQTDQMIADCNNTIPSNPRPLCVP